MDSLRENGRTIKTIKIALYYAHDYDLLALYYCGQFRTVLQEALRAVTRGNAYSFAFEETPIIMTKRYKTIVRCAITDPDTVDLLNDIAVGERTAFIKSVIRTRLKGAEKLYLPAKKEGRYHGYDAMDLESNNEGGYKSREDKNRITGQQPPFVLTPDASIAGSQATECQNNEDTDESEITVFDLVVSF